MLYAGLIGWVPNTDTLHALIREFRDTRKIPLNIEHRLMLGMAPDYDHLTIIQKVEVFRHAVESTSSEPSVSFCTRNAAGHDQHVGISIKSAWALIQIMNNVPKCTVA